MQVIAHAIAKKPAHMARMHGVSSECISLRRFATVHQKILKMSFSDVARLDRTIPHHKTRGFMASI